MIKLSSISQKEKTNQHSFFMKKMISIFFILAISVALTFCTDGEKEQNIEVPDGMVICDLSKFGKQFSMFIPDTANSKLEIMEQSWGALEIKVGKDFHVSITEDPGDIELRKSDIASNDVNVFKSYIIQEPLCIMWESQIIQPEFHFYVIKKIAGASYVFEDVVPMDGNPLKKEAVQNMLFSANHVIEMKKRDN